MIVDVRWRPSGGRGEYEHVPADVLLDRNIFVLALVSHDAVIQTDVWGKMRDGKPRLRREAPNDRSIINLPQIISALALLPDSIREDHGEVVFPLRRKGYVISGITFEVTHQAAQIAYCKPLRMRILHDGGEIDLVARLQRVGELLRSELVPTDLNETVARFLHLVDQGSASAEIRLCADQLMDWILQDSDASSFLDAPGEIALDPPASVENIAVKLDEISADETKRKLRTHYQIDRSRKVRFAKVCQFREKYNAVFCENCSFDFSKKYGTRGELFIEVHHIVPLAAILPSTVTYLSDLLLLCSNCHRMVHRRRPDLSPAQLKDITQSA